MRRRRGQLPPLGSKPVGQFVQSILNTAPKDVQGVAQHVKVRSTRKNLP